MYREILRMEHVSTNTGEPSDLNDFNISVLEAQIVGILTLGETGLEKLIEILQMNTAISDGQVYVREKLVNSCYETNSLRNNISIIDYNNRLVKDLTVLDNIAMSGTLKHGFLIRRKQLKVQLLWNINEFGLDLNPLQRGGELNGRQRCLVEIMRAVYCEARIIVLHGLSSFLSERDIQAVKKLVLNLKNERHYTFLYITNRYEEIDGFCDKAVIMNRGMDLKTLWKEDMTLSIYRNIIGEELQHNSEDSYNPGSEEILRFQNVYSNHLHGISFVQHERECLGIRLSLECQSSLVKMFTKEEEPMMGEISFCHKSLRRIKKKEICPHQVMIIEENALKTMLMYDLSYMDNLCMFLGKKLEKSMVSKKIDNSVKNEYRKLAGDVIDEENIYKLSKKERYTLIYARIELMNPKLVIILRPFIESDLSTQKHILELIGRLKRKNIAVLITLANIHDCTGVADRLIMTHKGKITQEYTKNEFDTIIPYFS